MRAPSGACEDMDGQGGVWLGTPLWPRSTLGSHSAKSRRSLARVLVSNLLFFLLSASFSAVLSPRVSFLPISPPPIKYDFRPLGRNMPARLSPPDTWAVCRRP